MIARIALGQVDVCRTSVPWVCNTPFGSAVDPEVCTMIARSAADTSASAAASTSAGTPSVAAAVVAHGRSVAPTTAMRRRYGAARTASRPAV